MTASRGRRPVRAGASAGGAPAPGSDAGAAVAALLETHGPRLRSLALRMCRNRDDADDMVQEAFLLALRKWHTFRGEADPGTWLYAIAGRLCKARLRRKGGIDRRTPAVSQLMPWSETTVTQMAAARAGDEDAAERNEAVGRVQAEIARLPEHLRVPLVMKDILGMPVEDVGAALGLAENTVKTRVHRARLALRKAMTAGAAAVAAPAPMYEKQVCFDLLRAKMAAMDRGGVAEGFKVPQAEVCARCRAVFRELDLVQDACMRMAEGEMPARLKATILAAVARHDSAVQDPGRRTGRGRRPVKSSAPRSRR